MKKKNITKLNTGLTTMIDGKGKVHVFTEAELPKPKTSWKQTASFMLQILTLGGVSLLMTYLFDL